MKNNIIFALYFMLICLFPLGVLVRFSPFDNVYIYPPDLVVGVIAIITFFTYVRIQSQKYRKLLIAIVLFNLISVLSLVLNSSNLNLQELLISLSYLLRFDAYISLLFLGIFELAKRRLSLLKRSFFISSLVFIVFGFVQYIFYDNLRNLYYLGWDEHLYRLFSTLLDPNYAGLLIVLILIMLIGNSYKKGLLIRSLWMNVVLVVFAFISVLLTHSRTAILSLVFAGILFFTLRRRFKLLAISVAIVVGSVLYVSDFSVEGLNPIRVSSSEARIQSMEEAFEIFADSPIYGIGFNAYRYVQIDKGFREKPSSISSNADAGTDNSLLFVLATTGIIGFIFYINIWIQVVSIVHALGFERVTIYSIVAALFIGSFFINALFYAPILLWVYLLVGIRIAEE